MSITYVELYNAVELANVRVVKKPNLKLNGDSPMGALLDQLNKLLEEKHAPRHMKSDDELDFADRVRDFKERNSDGHY